MFLRSNPKTIFHLSLVILFSIEIGRLTSDKKDLFDENSYFQKLIFFVNVPIIITDNRPTYCTRKKVTIFYVSALFLRIFFKLFFLTIPTNFCTQRRCRF